MTDHDDPDEPVLDEALRATLPVVAPPDGFAERVVSRHLAPTAPVEERTAHPAPPRRPSRRAAVTAGVLTLAAVAGLVLATRPAPESAADDHGELSADRRSTIPIGRRALAVVEAGSALAYTSIDDRTVVDQTRGDVFYRVAPAARSDETFVVRTPAGEVVVRGTCFRVEVTSMKGLKHAVGGAALGAGVTALVLVTVYEGKVSFANSHGTTEVAAGERVVAHAGSAPGPAIDIARTGQAPATSISDAPGASVTREELLARDDQQRRELQALRARVAVLEGQPPAAAGKTTEPGERPFFDPGAEELAQMAATCQLKWDSPALDPQEQNLDEEHAEELGVSEEQRVQLNKALYEFQVRRLTELRQLYLEVTGDTAGAEELSATSLVQEITRKSANRDVQLTFQRLSAERAGLTARPPDLSRATPFERMMRLVTSSGDEAEQAIGRVIGPERAHALRAARGGFGDRHTSNHGCPP
jgi:FecR protein